MKVRNDHIVLIHSVTALSQALEQLCTIAKGGRRASATEDPFTSVKSVNHALLGAPSTQAQSVKIEKLIQKMQTQEKFWEVPTPYMCLAFAMSVA